ncbi:MULTISPECIES: GGDEF domain-containing protein [unclassified Janthinobacterium]|uniref:GGDEF domain-containing protein n=1 Tax=unclassified Janthinobacterium TaxID=2610881 RepID=UPI00160E2B6E|nr:MULTISPECIES: GGDEF domain-containing protein [unclassified Janthinobacterium]MBB5370260.1 diguanylate cyclase (GGDEF)-like protein [Janthinobacterium sp. K2C7]MBB5383066.1 diguanylate cyclase (GGDEF)-like protein [Janthinobacterium sp. K2Li3]MBB5388455.1 diguanylate cyclase (GGDEF)-like protein [Janthinobacterium sp. K2E3]
MDSLLKHMVDMTGHRDHTMLDISVISAVQELASASQTRVLALTTVRGQVFVRSRAIIVAGSVARMEDNPDPSVPGEPLADYPALAACITRHEASADTVSDDGQHLLWLPIWIGDQVTTCLEITNPTPYTGATIQVIGGIVSVYRNFQNLLDYSERDSLTGLLNRKTFDDQLAKILQSRGDGETDKTRPFDAERRHHSDTERQWLAVIDVDHFKLVNDKFGHLYGDEVLILIANLLQSSFRSQDRIFRFGGEEFVVLLRSITLENAQKIIDRFRTNVEAHDFPQVGRVTVSVGFVSISAFEAPVIILGRADQALYYAKSHGRNLACHYDELVAKGMLTTIASNDTAEFF